jgi:Asp/Glu/hydantoin racemase
MKLQGGRSVYGEDIGILVLDTRFPRVHGDVANARTFGFPVRYKVVKDATQAEIVGAADRARKLLPAFIAAAQELESEGVRAITTTCGFLTVVQDELAAAVSVPVVTSSLFMVPMIRRMVGPRPVGIVTANASSLSERHLTAAGINLIDANVVRGLEGSAAFRNAILQGDPAQPPAIDLAAVEADVVRLCRDLVAEQPDLAALVFECTNLQPFADAVQQALGLPVFGIYQAIVLMQSAVRVPRFDGRL